MELTTLIIATLVSFATAQVPVADCYCSAPGNPEEKGGQKTGVEIAYSQYCCDAAVGVDSNLQDGEKPNWDEGTRTCSRWAVGLGSENEDDFQLCCVALMLKSTCYDIRGGKQPYTRARISGHDDQGKLMFEDVVGGDEIPELYRPVERPGN